MELINCFVSEQGVYSNSLGYFGGVSWAMLVARTCKFLLCDSRDVIMSLLVTNANRVT